tara:strand:- start:470 stop:736 length:267 start_codon:yes stop_codon:yes gene_type:complete
MGKGYRRVAVEKAVNEWDLHNWFSADSILPNAILSLPQKHMCVTVYAVAKALRMLEGKGVLLGRKVNGIKEYQKVEGAWSDGCSHFHA